jgi:hypothetical protein
VLSQHDLPLWARGATAGLVLFAAWWLLSTDVLRTAVGESLGLLCLGVISVFTLRGMHLPLSVWPDGPWRHHFSVIAVIGVAIAFAVLILIAGPNQPQELTARLDRGMIALVVIGAVFWGFAFGFVKQSPFLPWYIAAVFIALLPSIVSLVFGGGAAPTGGSMCVWNAGEIGQNGSTEVCRTAVLPSLLFLVPVGAAAKLVTEELAFRRVLIGQPGSAGLAQVVCSSVVAAVWFALLTWMDVSGSDSVVLGGLGALTAGCLYALSGSLLVSALYSAVFSASYWSLRLSHTESITDAGRAVPASLWASAVAVGAVVAVLLVRRNGLLGNHNVQGERDASGD